MSTIKFKRFTKPQFLKQIGRQLLDQFFGKFNVELSERQIILPPSSADDEAYFNMLSRIALSPEGLPQPLVEAAYAIENMANEEGQDRLERAVGANGPAFQFQENSSCADMAIQAWLANPELFIEKFGEHRLIRLASFEYFGPQTPVDRSISFVIPSAQVVAQMTADMEQAFSQRNRGRQATHIDVHLIDDEYWFLIRHGDTYSRVPTVSNGQMSVLHFRPTKDDVVVYSPARDEIRIHAVTKWEKDLYRATFGRHLFADDWYFSGRKVYSLDPLRSDGVDGLDVSNIPGLNKIVLREVEVSWPGEYNCANVRKSMDLFASEAEMNATAIPETGTIGRAVFDFYFADSQKPRKVQLRPPNVLRIGRHCDLVLVQRWLTERGFRSVVPGEANRGGIIQSTMCQTLSGDSN